MQATILPVSIEDELTQKGASKVVLGLLTIFGLLQIKNYRTISLPDNYENKVLLLVGDGLSQSRLMGLKCAVEEGSYNINQRRKNLNVIRKALHQVINCPGDLHGQFHVMRTIYYFFYGLLLQPIQAGLG